METCVSNLSMGGFIVVPLLLTTGSIVKGSENLLNISHPVKVGQDVLDSWCSWFLVASLC